MNHLVKKRSLLASAAGLLFIATSCTPTEALPAYDSMDDVYRAVDGHVGCADHVHGPPVEILNAAQPTGESRMCTNSVEILWFKAAETHQEARSMAASAADPSGSVHIVEGANWFVIDLSEVQHRSFPDREIDMKELAAALNARYSIEQ
ncbi:hypothetical protein [Kocuria atrinae]|uniref:hypothetical protein n=1 Tax=Kocuria atrinae TaxID=592377 RepID=UPI00030EE18D|nr:hypothetical protein [Kocuria atrinae]